MQRAILFFLAALAVVVVAYTQTSKEGFTTLMGVNWTSMNDGTPKALYTDLPIKQPKAVDIAEAGVGNIQPSPPPAEDLPTAPFGQRSKEVPNPYRDPSTEPAKYIRLLGVKEDLQAFFAFDAPLLESRSDPALQIPLTRARADMGELVDIQSVMERNPGLPSRINNKQLNDMSSNLRYLRAMLRDLEASGAVQPSSKTEGFADMGYSHKDVPATLTELQDFQIKVVVELNRLKNSGAQDQDSLTRVEILDRIKRDIDSTIKQVRDGTLAPSNIPIYSSDLQSAGLFLDGTAPRRAISSPDASSTFKNNKAPRATLKQLQEFQIKVVTEQQNLTAAGTSDPIVLARINVLQTIKVDVDQIIRQLQQGELKPNAVPIYASDLERAFPILGKPTNPLPDIVQPLALMTDSSSSNKQNSMFPGLNLPNMQDGLSWQLTLKYDNPKLEKLKYKNTLQTARLLDISKTLGNRISEGGLPGVAPSAQPSLQAMDVGAQQNSPNPSSMYRTDAGYDSGLPGASLSRTLPTPPPAQLDWKQRNKEIVEQIRRRGYDPVTFGALAADAEVSPSFSWRGHTQMMCMRLNSTSDPGLAVSVGCPPQGWAGWRS